MCENVLCARAKKQLQPHLQWGEDCWDQWDSTAPGTASAQLSSVLAGIVQEQEILKWSSSIPVEAGSAGPRPKCSSQSPGVLGRKGRNKGMRCLGSAQLLSHSRKPSCSGIMKADISCSKLGFLYAKVIYPEQFEKLFKWAGLFWIPLADSHTQKM